MLKDKDKKISPFSLGCAVIFLFLVAFVVFSDKPDKKNNPVENRVDSVAIKELFNKIGTNYQLDIKEINNENEYNHIYFSDSNIKLYESDELNYGLVSYKGKLYSLDGNTKKLTIDNKYYEFVDNNYYDLAFISKVVNKCNFEFVSMNNVSCELPVVDYINDYNEYYHTNYDNFSTDNMNILVEYSNNINKIIIDYSYANKLIYGSDDKIKYELKISAIDKNDFSELIEYYKDVLNK